MTITISPATVRFPRSAAISPASQWRNAVGLFWDASGNIFQDGKFKPKAITWGGAMDTLRKLDNSPAAQWARDYLLAFPIPVQWADGDDIHEVFEKYRHLSCMRYESCHDMRTLYSNNSDTVGCAYWLKGSHPALEAHGSCLVWLGENGVYADRVYTAGFSFPADVIRASIGRGIASLFEDKTAKTIYSNGLGLEPAGKVTLRGLLPPDEGLLPYSDTMRFTWDGRRLTVSNRDGFEATSTDGTTLDGDEANRCRCCNCGEGVHDEDTRYTENGDGPYCDDCYSELFSYCAMSQCDYPADEVSERSFLYRGRVRTEYVSDDWLSNNCYEYAGRLYADEITHIDTGYATEIDGVGYVADEELQDINTEEIGENAAWVDCYFGDAVAIEDAKWDARIGAWIHGDTDEEFLSDYFRLCAMAGVASDTSEFPEYHIGGGFYITNTRGRTEFEIRHKLNNSGNFIRYLYTLDSALAALGWIVANLANFDIGHLWGLDDYKQWNSYHGARLRELVHAYQYRKQSAVLWRVNHPMAKTRNGYVFMDRGDSYVHGHGGVLAAYRALLRNLPPDNRPRLSECYFYPVN